MILHLRDQLERWRNTNFSKYVSASLNAVSDDQPRRPLVDVHTLPPAHVQRGPTADVLLRSLQSILREQLPTGEIPTYFRASGAGLEYRRSPLVSTFVHDALAGFDLNSPWVETGLLDALPAAFRGKFVRGVAGLRSRIRNFLCWEEDSSARWRFNGRGGGDFDSDTTACCAAAVLQAPRRKPHATSQRQVEALVRDGVLRREALDPIARVNILRFLTLMGEPAGGLLEDLVSDLRGNNFHPETDRYSHPLSFAFCVARAWAHTDLPCVREVQQMLINRILALAGEMPRVGGPLGTALALNALLDLGYTGSEIVACGQYLLSTALPRGGWIYAPFLARGGGSPACTTAFAMAALARSGVGR
jgi:hypothetical protein